MRRVVMGLVAVSLTGCVRIPGFSCEDNEQCVDRQQGICEPSGFCSYPDDDCESLRRYSDLAGSLASNCVPEEVETDASEPAPSDEGSSSTDGSSAPGGEVRWSVAFSGDGGEDSLNAVVLLATGTLAVAGREGVANTEDALLATLDDAGNVLTHRAHDVAGGLDELVDLVQASDGVLWGCGRADPPGQLRAWVAEFRPPFDGGPSRSLQLEHQVCRTVQQVSNQSLLVAGDDNQFTMDGLGAWAYAFEPWDPQGGMAVFSTASPDDALLASATLGGGAVVLGGRLEMGNLSISALPDIGTPLFEGGAGAIQGMAATSDRLTVGGYEWTSNQACAWVAEIAPDGSPRWSWRRTPPNALGDEIEAVAIDAEGNTIAVGFVTTQSRARLLVKLDPNGVELWSKVWPSGPDGLELLRDVAILPDDDIVVVGQVTGDDGSLDGWVARLSP